MMHKKFDTHDMSSLSSKKHQVHSKMYAHKRLSSFHKNYAPTQSQLVMTQKQHKSFIQLFFRKLSFIFKNIIKAG